MELLRKYTQLKTRLALGAAVLMMAGSLSAATFTTQAPGNWTTGGTWVGGIAPSSTDDVVIGHAVTVSTAVSIKDVTINSGGTLNLTTGTVETTGNFTRNGTGVFTMGNTLTTYLRFSGGASQVLTGSLTGSNAIVRMRLSKTANTTLTLNSPIEVTTLYQADSGVLVVPGATDFKILYDGSDTAQFGFYSPSSNALVVGNVVRRIDSSKAGVRTAWVADLDSGVYESALVRLNIAATSTGTGTITIATKKGDSPWPAPLPSGMNPNDILDRYWTIESAGFSGNINYSARFNYRGPGLTPNDFSGSMIESNNLRPVRFYQEVANGNFWTADGTAAPQVEGSLDRVTVSGLSQPTNTTRIWTIFESAALKVDLASLTAAPLEGGAGVRVDWTTAGEVSNAGFNVYRALSGFGSATITGQRLTTSLIPAAGDGTVGGVYGFVDETPLVAGESRSYILEDIDLNGLRTLHGPVTATYGAAVAGDTKSVSNALNNLTSEYWQSGSTADFAAPVFSTEGLAEAVPAGANGVFGFWETKSNLEALPAGEYRLRALVDWNRVEGATLPQLRSRVFPAGHVTSWSTVVNDRAGSTIPTVVETSFTSDGTTPFRVAFDLLGFGPNVAGGFKIAKVEIVPAN